MPTVKQDERGVTEYVERGDAWDMVLKMRVQRYYKVQADTTYYTQNREKAKLKKKCERKEKRMKNGRGELGKGRRKRGGR